MDIEKYVEKYQELFKKRFCKDLNQKEAYDQLLRLFVLVQETYKPMTQEELDEVNKDKERIRKKHERRNKQHQ